MIAYEPYPHEVALLKEAIEHFAEHPGQPLDWTVGKWDTLFSIKTEATRFIDASLKSPSDYERHSIRNAYYNLRYIAHIEPKLSDSQRKATVQYIDGKIAELNC